MTKKQLFYAKCAALRRSPRLRDSLENTVDGRSMPVLLSSRDSVADGIDEFTRPFAGHRHRVGGDRK